MCLERFRLIDKAMGIVPVATILVSENNPSTTTFFVAGLVR